MNEITIEVWGDLACFSRPESKVERLTYPVITPSAARGILSAVYSKPVEFYWQVCRIEVLKPIRYISFKRNEIKDKTNAKRPDPILIEDNHTQRQTVALRDVRYRITARIVPRDDFKGTVTRLYEQAVRRIRGGKCFYQPSLGLREFVCYFGEPTDAVPIPDSLDLGIMLYDVFDLHNVRVTNKTKPYVSLFHANMVRGVIEVPDYDNELVLKPERR